MGAAEEDRTIKTATRWMVIREKACYTAQTDTERALTGVGGWCCGGDWCQIHLRNVKVITVICVLGSAHTVEVSAECL